MDDKDFELMERYIYQVVRRLPKEQRDDVSMELRELIGDMAEEKESVREALVALGDPAEFAKKYAGESRYLIGPLYIDTYWNVLKIALTCTVIAIFSITLGQGIVERYDPGLVTDLGSIIGFVTYLFSTTLSNTMNSAIGIFGIVTIVFMIMEHYKVDLEEGKDKAWTVDDLPKKPSSEKDGVDERAIWTPERLAPVPGKKAMLPRGDSIADIVFSVIFGAILIFAPHILGVVWVIEDNVIGKGVMTIPIFNLDKWNLILPVFLISLLAGLTDAILRVIIGRYNLKVMVSSIVSGLIQIVCSVTLFKILPIWNPHFGNELRRFLDNEFGATEFANYFDPVWFSNVILTIIIIATMVEVGITAYRTLRYGLNEERSEDKVKA
ncbi:MAG: hypothetical protein GXY43_06990 [Clostridiaceae bacterium]|nr:hypothetical protein [Clostridiaceae bacterium]